MNMIRLCQWPENEDESRDGFDLDDTPGLTRKTFCTALMAIIAEGDAVSQFIKDKHLKDEDWQKWCLLMSRVKALSSKMNDLGSPEDWVPKTDIEYFARQALVPIQRFIGILRTTLTKNHALQSSEINMLAFFENMPEQYIYSKIEPRPVVMS